MEKLKIVVVSENAVSNMMGGCGKNWDQLCGLKQCSSNNTSKDD